MLTTDALLSCLAPLAPGARDEALERLLGIDEARDLWRSPGPELIGYHPSSVAAVSCALLEAAVGEDDLFIDLGAGVGKVVALARLLCGARARGIEVQGALVERSVRVDGVELVHADVRHAPLEDGTVFFLYNPFTGAVLRDVLARLNAVARHHAIVVCALGVELEHVAQAWLSPRPSEHFWLRVFDSVVPGVPARVPQARQVDPRVQRLALER
jgi:SAM-dependent methyltransferase